jgi:hypothetical protein
VPHLADGTLRRLHDEPAAAIDDERRHLAQCPLCRARAAELGRQAKVVRIALGAPSEESTELQAALAVVKARSLAESPAVARFGFGPQAKARRFPAALLAAAAVAAALLLLLTLTPLRTLASGFLAIFEPRELVAVPVTRADLEQLRALPDLSAFGTVRNGPNPPSASVASARAAALVARMPVLVPSVLPPGSRTASYSVLGARSASFTFSAAKARLAAAASHHVLPPMPARIDGSTLVATIGPVVVGVYGHVSGRIGIRRSRGESFPALVVAQAPVPRIGSSGASAREIEAYLLAQPGVPPQLAAEIRAIGEPETTLPIPIPIERAYALPVAVQGVNGLAIGDDTGLGAGVLWERGGALYVVAGTLPIREIVLVANSLR